MADTRPEQEQKSLLAALFEPSDLIEIRALRDHTQEEIAAGAKGRKTTRRWWGRLADMSGLLPKIRKAEEDGFDLYFGANPRTVAGGKGTDVSCCRSVCVDLDNVSFDEAVSQLSASGMPAPTATVATGGGVHFWWRLVDEAGPDQFTAGCKALIAAFPSADRCIHDPPRIMRLPGTRNQKRGVVATTIDVAAVRTPLSAICVRKQASPADRARAYVSKMPASSEGRRNADGFVVATRLREFGLVGAEARGLLEEWNSRNTPPMPAEELSAILDSAAKYAANPAGKKLDEAPVNRRAPTNGIDHKALSSLAESCYLVIGTTMVWHHSLGMSMPIEALVALHPVEGKLWRKAADKRTIRPDQIVFEPDPARVRPGDVNLWTGLDLSPDPRPCPLLVGHLLMLCDGDAAIAEWMRKWMALPLKSPGTKLDSAIIMAGPQGTGKSMLWDCYRRIFGTYGCLINQTTLEDSYTGWASKRLCIQAEEVGSTPSQRQRVRNILKHWVTGESIEIREKYQVARVERNLANFVFLSNESLPIPVDPDDRRFLVVRHAKKSDTAYFKALGAEIADNGSARLLAWLLATDMAGFDQHTPPPWTEAKTNMTDLCKHSPQAFLDDWSEGAIRGLTFQAAASTDLYSAYAAYCVQTGMKAESHKSFSIEMQRLGLRKTSDGTRRYFDPGTALTASVAIELFEKELAGYIRDVERSRAR